MIRARIVAVKTEEQNLKPGDLYSERGPEYWNKAMGKNYLPGVPLLVRTNDETQSDPHASVFRLTVVLEDTEKGTSDRDSHVIKPEFDPHKPPGAPDA